MIKGWQTLTHKFLCTSVKRYPMLLSFTNRPNIHPEKHSLMYQNHNPYFRVHSVSSIYGLFPFILEQWHSLLHSSYSNIQGDNSPHSNGRLYERPTIPLYGRNVKRNPQTLKELSQVLYQKQVFINTKKELFSVPKAELGPVLPGTPLSKKSKSSFLFSVIAHIYIFIGSSAGIMWLIPFILFAIKQRKMKTLVSAMALHQAKPIEAVAASTSMPAEQTEALMRTSVLTLLEKLSGMDILTNSVTKLVCHDPWVSFIVTLITIVGVVVYVYRSCRNMSFLKGHKFASICNVHIIFCNNTRYVPLKIGHYIGSPFLFQYNELPLVENITLHKHCLWDILHVEWDEERIHYKDRSIPLREHLSVPLKDKIRLRWILKKNYQVMYMVKQGDTWYNLTKL